MLVDFHPCWVSVSQQDLSVKSSNRKVSPFLTRSSLIHLTLQMCSNNNGNDSKTEQVRYQMSAKSQVSTTCRQVAAVAAAVQAWCWPIMIQVHYWHLRKRASHRGGGEGKAGLGKGDGCSA